MGTRRRFADAAGRRESLIVIGVSAWTWIVATQKHFSALAGSVALAVLMIPMVMRTTEELLNLVPISLREAALALGYPRWRASLVVVLRTALPGIVTGLALQATILDVLGPLGVSFGLATNVIGHATFCVVVVYNNVIARMRRTTGSLDEASADLGADSWQTFRYVLFPQLRTALLAGALLAFALSFDEVVVTIFTAGAQQTLPIWIFATLARPAQLPIVNVVALFVIVVSIIPVYIAARLAGGAGLTSDRPAKGAVAAQGPIEELKGPAGRVFELRVKGDLPSFIERLREAGLETHSTDQDVMRVFVPAGNDQRQIFALAARHGVQVRHLRASVPTLEDVFAKAVGED